MNPANTADIVLPDIEERLTLNGNCKVFDTGKELRTEFMKEKEKPEAFTREFRIDEISKKFYGWYNALLHGGRYKDHENKLKTVSDADCMVNNVIGVRDLEEREQIAQVVMNRLIFIKFLQSRGIIKVDILRYLAEVKEEVLTPKLRQLFFGVLNTPEAERVDVNERFKNIPYLNGSLFVHTEVEKKNAEYKIKAEILKKAIEFLDSFKFVHKEQFENAGSIDPEILGYIFERAMTAADRKGTGAYYTPRQITRYISENTIYPYIINRTNDFLKTKKGYKETELIEDIEKLFMLPATTLKEIWKEVIQELRVLDNACGSGAFLLAAANILFDLNIRINDKIGAGNSDAGLKKRILMHNLYGVDINPSGIEIAKLRLWLWLVDSYEPEEVEPLPNIDYNLRAGNSLIGYVDTREFWQTKRNLLNYMGGEEKPTLDALVNERNNYLRQYKTAEGEEARDLREKLSGLDEKIKKLLDANCYLKFRAKGIKITKEAFMQIKPFHWGFEFYEVFDASKPEEERGFDIIIGNPPYVELNKMGYGNLFPESKNLYDEFMRISIKKLLCPAGMLGFIHANSAYYQPKYKALRDFLKESTDNLTIINFAIRPQPVFKGVMQRTAITICRKDIRGAKSVKTSRYIRLTEENRNKVLGNPPLYDCSDFAWQFADFIPKIGNEFDYQIFKKVVNHDKSIEDILTEKECVSLFYHDSGESYWTKLLTYEPRGIREGKEVMASQWFKINVNRSYADFVTCAVNSTLFYWFWLTISDCRHLTQEVLKEFPIPSADAISQDITKKLRRYSKKLMKCYEQNSYFVEKRRGYKSREFKVNRCKKLINEIDGLIGEIYGLTDDEIMYLIEYDMEMRID